MKHLGTVELESDRLILRRCTVLDAYEMYNNWASSPNVTKYLSWETNKNVNESRDILRSWSFNYVKQNFYQWMIVLKETSQVIGTIGVVNQKGELGYVEIGYCIGEPWWNKGIMTEAFKRVIKFFFEDVQVNRIEARHDIKNPGSGKVMEKSGLKYEGTLRQVAKNNSGLCDLAVYSILAKEYFIQVS